MSEWQPIETAPKNPTGTIYGPWILVFSSYDHGIYKVRWAFHDLDDGGWYEQNRKTNTIRTWCNHATHWMPLPEPPNA